MDRAHTFSRPIGLCGDSRKASSTSEQGSEGWNPEDSSEGSTLRLLHLPDSLLLEIFMSLPLESVVSVTLTCSRFSRIASDEQLWKRIFQRDFKVSRSVPMHPRASSWRAEYRRLTDESPAVLCEEVMHHKDQALHVSFSHNGEMFATSSKDGTIKVWNATTPCTLKYAADMKARFTWRYTQYCQFNKSDTLLLISGVHEGDNTTTGEIAVFDLTQDFMFMSRVLNKPYDVFGAWYDDSHLLFGTLRWIGHLESISAVWLSKATRSVNSKRKYTAMNPFRFNNYNASSIRTIMVADVPLVTQNSQPASDSQFAVCSECGLDIFPEDAAEFPVGCGNRNLNNNSGDFCCNEGVAWLERVRVDIGDEGDTDRVDGNGQEVCMIDMDSDDSCGQDHPRRKPEGAEETCSIEMGMDESCPPGCSGQEDRNEETGPSCPGSMETSNSRFSIQSFQFQGSSYPIADESSARRKNPVNRNQVSTKQAARPSSGEDDSSHSLNHSPAKSICHRQTLADQALDSFPPMPSSACLWCCCQRKQHENSFPASRHEECDMSRTWNWHPQAPGPTPSRKGGTASPYQPLPTTPAGPHPAVDAAYQHASDIPRTSTPCRARTMKRTEKLLIFTLGEETYSPHLVGIKRMKEEELREEEEAAAGLGWPETEGLGWLVGEGGLLPLSDRDVGGTGRATALDCTINMHGHIVGMALSPDERYLYVNSRQWPQNYKIERVMEPPPIAQEIDIHVIDLQTCQEVGTIMRSHKAFTPNDECFFLFLDVSDLYVASGAEDKRGYIWDRHYGVHLRCFPHSDVVNSCAFNPADPEMLVTVSDDTKIKIWRSRRQMREMRKREDSHCQ